MGADALDFWHTHIVVVGVVVIPYRKKFLGAIVWPIISTESQWLDKKRKLVTVRVRIEEGDPQDKYSRVYVCVCSQFLKDE